jgi:glycosyltransferase involved in cell wall biosynthesis
VRVLVDALSVAPGGGATVARELLRELGSLDPADRYDILIKDSLLPGMPDWPSNIMFERVGRIARGVSTRTIWEQTRLPGRVRKGGYDLLFGLGGFGMLHRSMPQVVIVQNALFYAHMVRPTSHVWLKRRAQQAVQLRTLKSGATGVCVSESIRRLVAPLVPGHVRLVVIPNGVTAPDRLRTDRKPDSVTSPRILWVGSGAPHKNPVALLDALLHIDLPVEVAFAGIPPDQGQEMLLDRHRVLSVDERVRFLGRVPHDQLSLEYQVADLYVSTSLAEASPLTPLEAMAAGTPIVLSDIPAHKETAPHALFYPPGDAERLAAIITSALSDPVGRSRMVAMGLDLAKTRSWNHVARAYRSEFDRLVSYGSDRIS